MAIIFYFLLSFLHEILNVYNVCFVNRESVVTSIWHTPSSVSNPLSILQWESARSGRYCRAWETLHREDGPLASAKTAFHNLTARQLACFRGAHVIEHLSKEMQETESSIFIVVSCWRPPFTRNHDRSHRLSNIIDSVFFDVPSSRRRQLWPGRGNRGSTETSRTRIKRKPDLHDGRSHRRQLGNPMPPRHVETLRIQAQSSQKNNC